MVTVLAKTLLKRKKEYYSALEGASKNCDITEWLLWFSSAVIEAQRRTFSYIAFIVSKTVMMERLRGQLNPRQEKVLLRLFSEGPEGFIGGLSAANYKNVTRAPTATATRDLVDLVKKGALLRQGERKTTRYYLAIEAHPVSTVTVDEIK